MLFNTWEWDSLLLHSGGWLYELCFVVVPP